MSVAARLLADAIEQAPLRRASAASHGCRGGTHSHLDDGTVLCWRPRPVGAERYAVDAERADQPVPPALARRWGSADPAQVWPRWTRLEVLAKLHGIPILVLVSREGPDLSADAGDEETALRVTREAGLVVCRGVALAS